jgi:hypothetical protein
LRRFSLRGFSRRLDDSRAGSRVSSDVGSRVGNDSLICEGLSFPIVSGLCTASVFHTASVFRPIAAGHATAGKAVAGKPTAGKAVAGKAIARKVTSKKSTARKDIFI